MSFSFSAIPLFSSLITSFFTDNVFLMRTVTIIMIICDDHQLQLLYHSVITAHFLTQFLIYGILPGFLISRFSSQSLHLPLSLHVYCILGAFVFLHMTISPQQCACCQSNSIYTYTPVYVYCERMCILSMHIRISTGACQREVKFYVSIQMFIFSMQMSQSMHMQVRLCY